MSALEELMYSQLTSDTTLSVMLSKFNNSPAVFEFRAPEDTDDGWNGLKQYPRIDYTVQRHEDPERKVFGSVMFNVWDDTNDGTTIETIAARIQADLDGAVYHPADEPVIGYRWKHSEFFTAGRSQPGMSMSELEPTDLLYGITIEFDLFAFPTQTTFSPDPIDGLNTWAKNNLTGVQVDPTSWTPTSGTPALYWRLEALQLASRLQAVSWYDATIYGHVLAPQPTDRLNKVRAICEALMNGTSVTLNDGSYMLLIKLQADTKQDPLRRGQIRLTAHYGILVPVPAQTTLGKATVSGAVTGTVV